MTEPRLKISPPWVTYINQLQAIFDEDPQIAFNVDFNGSHPSVVLSTSNPDKAAALKWLLPESKDFGNITLTIGIDCPKVSNLAFATAKELFETAFSNNPVFSYVVVPEGYWYIPLTYVVFKNCVVQFFADNLNDCHGIISCLYEDLAREVLAGTGVENGVFFNTDVECGSLGKPLGEWP